MKCSASRKTQSNMADEKKYAEESTVSQRKRRRHEWWKMKRKQTDRNEGDNAEQPQKKRKKLKHVEKRKHAEGTNEETDSKTANSTFILFIGNLSYECTEDDIRNHFDFHGGLTDVRMLADKTTGKSKGCAFLQFESKKMQMNALELHHSTLCGRRINVEVTCGGGGKGEQRMKKLRSKIDKMKEKRKKAKLKRKQVKNQMRENTMNE